MFTTVFFNKPSCKLWRYMIALDNIIVAISNFADRKHIYRIITGLGLLYVIIGDLFWSIE